MRTSPLQSLSEIDLDKLTIKLAQQNNRFEQLFSQSLQQRQPVHTLYGGADRFDINTSKKIGDIALSTLEQYADNGAKLASILNINADTEDKKVFVDKLYQKVTQKLKLEALEDLRIDFEDGYGYRPDEEEDQDAKISAAKLAEACQAGTTPPFIGIRIKTLSNECMGRAIRTLDIFLTSFKSVRNELPENFVITLPKVNHCEQISTLINILEKLESTLGFPPIPIELIIETPQAIINEQGHFSIPAFIYAAKGRLRGLHFGSYDYLSSTNISAADANHIHPNSDFARHIMQVCSAGTNIVLSDSITNVIPVAVHKPKTSKNKDRDLATQLNADEQLENQNAIHSAWNIHFKNIKRSLKHGFYQGWDLHPNQVPIRYFAIYHHFHIDLINNIERLNHFVDAASKATLSGSTFDDAATGQVLVNFFLQGIACGAFSLEDINELKIPQKLLKTKSFKKIIEASLKK